MSGVPQLHECPRCHKHWHLVFADGTDSSEFATQQQGFDMLMMSIALGRATTSDNQPLRHQIFDRVPECAEPAVVDCVALFNQRLREGRLGEQVTCVLAAA